MYYTHHFAHHETLRRACEWLERFGFHADSHGLGPSGSPRLSLLVGLGALAEVELLISAVERSDPHGWPGFWDRVREVEAGPGLAPATSANEGDATRRGVIGWHPIDAETTPGLDHIHAAMGH